MVLLHESVKFYAGEMFHFLFQEAKFFFHLNDILFRVLQFLVDRGVTGQHFLLSQVSQGFSFGYDYFSFISGELPHDDFQKRGFSGAVNSHNGGLFVFFYMKRSMIYNFINTKCFADILT